MKVSNKELSKEVNDFIQLAKEMYDKLGKAEGIALYNSAGKVVNANGEEIKTGSKTMGKRGFMEATQDGQTDFAIPLSMFDRSKDAYMFIKNTTYLEDEMFTITDKTLKLNEGVPIGTKIYFMVIQNVENYENLGLIRGSAIEDGSVQIEKLSDTVIETIRNGSNRYTNEEVDAKIQELFTLASNGKNKLKAVTGLKDETTFDELANVFQSFKESMINKVKDINRQIRILKKM